jgi:hypothetical protein
MFSLFSPPKDTNILSFFSSQCEYAKWYLRKKNKNASIIRTRWLQMKQAGSLNVRKSRIVHSVNSCNESILPRWISDDGRRKEEKPEEGVGTMLEDEVGEVR